MSSAATKLGLPEGTRACLFDLDGVLTATAALHAIAWKKLFDDFLQARAGSTGERFIPFHAVADYDRYVDGKLRADGARSFLASRGIKLDDDGVAALAARKDELFLELLRSRGVQVYPGSRRYLDAVRARGLATAVVSASRHCQDVLAAAGLADRFDARVDGQRAAAEHLAGKPAPDTYVAAARAVGVEPAHAAVFEDALAGVEAGRAGRFGFVVGVDRAGQADELRGHGADVVVSDLGSLLERA
jgi:beta-phosphoglucomutase family hydrolase